MNGFRLVSPARLVLILGSIAGLIAGSTAVALAGATLTGSEAPDSPAALEANHLPPLLTVAGEDVTLSYEVFCLGDDAGVGADGSCDVAGTAFVRSGRESGFTELPLVSATSSEGRRLVAHVPEAIAAAPQGFEYFAELQSAGRESTTIPAAGASSPHRSLRLLTPIDVELGRHVFGKTRAADARVATAPWGDGPANVGLEEGRNLSPIGASAFDVGRGGVVHLLDEAGRRVLRFGKGDVVPTRTPVSVSGSLADMTVASDGSIYVLETVGRLGGTPIVRRFDGDGRELERVEIAERSASQIRASDAGPVVLEQPAHQWMPVTAGGTVANAKAQRAGARVGRPLPDGGEVVVLRVGDEIRVALTRTTGARRSWRLRSETRLGEVQLAQPVGSRLIVVARMYTDDEAEFVVLVLDGHGLRHQFSLSPAEWAEAAPLGRFKLVGSSLYRLGSSASGAFVDRFDLEVLR